MFKVIDRTLTAIELKENEPTPETLYEMCELLGKTGVDYIELTCPILQRMKKLPEGNKYILQIESLCQKEVYEGFDYYKRVVKTIDELVHKEKLKVGAIGGETESIIYEMEVNSIKQAKEVLSLVQSHKVCVTGLADLMRMDYERMMEEMMEGEGVGLCPKNTYYCATAIAMEWLMKGGESVYVSFNGLGNYAKLEEVMMAIKVMLHKKLRADLSVLPRLTTLYEQVAHTKIKYNKAVLGKNIFNLEASIYTEQLDEKSMTYEAYDPKEVGKVRHLVIGKHSGVKALKLKLKETGLSLNEALLPELLEIIKETCINKERSLRDHEFIQIVKGMKRDEMLYS